MRQLRPARKPAVARVRAGTHDYPPPVPDLLPILVSPPLPPGQTRTRPRTVGHTVPTRGMFSGTILYFRYKVTSRHVTSRHVQCTSCPVITLLWSQEAAVQGRSMDENINIIWKLHGRWVCCNILPSSVLSTCLLQVKPGNEFDYFLILAELVWLDLAYAW